MHMEFAVLSYVNLRVRAKVACRQDGARQATEHKVKQLRLSDRRGHFSVRAAFNAARHARIVNGNAQVFEVAE